MLPFRTNVIDIEGDKIQFTIGADQKISVKNPRIKASEDFTCALARVIIEIPQHLDIYSQLSPEVDKDTGEIDESAKELNRFVAISKITFGLDDFGEYVDIVLTMKAKNFTKRMKVDVPRAYLRNSDEMQMDMFPVETENHLIELRGSAITTSLNTCNRSRLL